MIASRRHSSHLSPLCMIIRLVHVCVLRHRLSSGLSLPLTDSVCIIRTGQESLSHLHHNHQRASPPRRRRRRRRQCVTSSIIIPGVYHHLSAHHHSHHVITHSFPLIRCPPPPLPLSPQSSSSTLSPSPSPREESLLHQRRWWYVAAVSRSAKTADATDFTERERERRQTPRTTLRGSFFSR